MAKEVVANIKVELLSGQATPAPPVGPALGQHGVNIGQFISEFNARTRNGRGERVPVEITVFKDKTFTFVVRQPTVAYLLKEAAGIAKGSGRPNTEKAGAISHDELKRIAQRKMPDLNTNDLEAAMRIIAGTARSMGIEISDDAPVRAPVLRPKGDWASSFFADPWVP